MVEFVEARSDAQHIVFDRMVVGVLFDCESQSLQSAGDEDTGFGILLSVCDTHTRGAIGPIGSSG